MTTQVDTDKIIEALTKDNVLYQHRIQDLTNRLFLLERTVMGLVQKSTTFPTPDFKSSTSSST